eukprot:TRINITY_DN106670_c0_g1_i1.p1 TRINITY_DN106670_c0_g1~~TRINITY_DN106670_c0_g1_i1.p1  ORF type:complete len:594 (-),score=114.42 TRINITY_DN106670_c0_g1_i1:46-1827(-)
MSTDVFPQPSPPKHGQSLAPRLKHLDAAVAQSIREARKAKRNAQGRLRDAERAGDEARMQAAQDSIRQLNAKISLCATDGARSLCLNAAQDATGVVDGAKETMQAATVLHSMAAKADDKKLADEQFSALRSGVQKSLSSSRELMCKVGAAAKMVVACCADDDDAMPAEACLPKKKRSRQTLPSLDWAGSSKAEANISADLPDIEVDGEPSLILKPVDVSYPGRHAEFHYFFDVNVVERLMAFAMQRETLRKTGTCESHTVRTYRFTNVLPEDDRTSQKKDEKLEALAGKSAQSVLLAAAVVVLFGDYNFIDKYTPVEEFNAEHIHQIVITALQARESFGHAFTDGYRLWNFKSEHSVASAYQAYMDQVRILIELSGKSTKIDELICKDEGWKPIVEWLREPNNIKGIDTFLAKEIGLLLVRCGAIKPHRGNHEWSPVACGAEKGHRRLLLAQHKQKRFSNAELEHQLQLLLSWIQDRYGDFVNTLGHAKRQLGAHDLQNLECEFNKLEAVENHEGGRRRVYVPWSERKEQLARNPHEELTNTQCKAAAEKQELEQELREAERDVHHRDELIFDLICKFGHHETDSAGHKRVLV